MINKKGLSAVVTTLIMILLTLVAIGMIWLVVMNIVGDTTGRIDSLTQCIDAKIEITAVACGPIDTWNCTVSLYNNAGGKSIDGVRLTFSNDSDISPGEIFFVGDVPELTTESRNVNANISNSNNVKAYIYIEDSSGNRELCEQPVNTLTY